MLNVAALKEIGTITKYETDALVVSQGEQGAEMFIMLQGSVEVVVHSDFDGSEMRLAVLNTGDSFGEMSMIQGKARSATIRTLEDCILFRIHVEKFVKFIEKEPKMALNMMRVLSKRIVTVEEDTKKYLEEKEALKAEVINKKLEKVEGAIVEESEMLKKLKELND